MQKKSLLKLSKLSRLLVIMQTTSVHTLISILLFFFFRVLFFLFFSLFFSCSSLALYPLKWLPSFLIAIAHVSFLPSVRTNPSFSLSYEESNSRWRGQNAIETKTNDDEDKNISYCKANKPKRLYHYNARTRARISEGSIK